MGDPLRRWLDYSGVELAKAFASGDLERSPQQRQVGLRPVDAETGKIELVWDVTPLVVTAQGYVHGGYVAMVLDDACCMAGATLDSRFVPMLTLSLYIDYCRPVRSGNSYAVTGEVAYSGNSRRVAKATIVDADGKVFAQATGSVIPNPAFVRPADQ